MVVADLLHQTKFNYAHFPELVDLAVIGTGLGALRSNLPLVNSEGSYWDTTQWEVTPRKFLGTSPLAYASAVAAWIRGDKDPLWANDLQAEIKAPMKKSLKYLHKTNDSFFQPAAATPPALSQSQEHWWQLAATGKPSSQVIALRQLELDGTSTEQQQTFLVDNLRTNDTTILLHTIDAMDRIKETSKPTVDELLLLVEHRDDVVRAKACWTLTKLDELDEPTLHLAAKMLDNKVRFIVFTGINALASLDTVPDQLMPAVDRGFLRALQNCDFEFVSLFVAAYQRWHDDPKAHFESMLADDSPEYLELALEALQNVREQLIALG